MNQLEKPVAEVQNASDILDQLAASNLALPERDAVEAYLGKHPDLACLLGDMCKKVQTAFGPTAELSLEIYIDPEIDDRYLTLCVRQDAYAADIIDRIDAVSAGFHASLETVSGDFLVTTDFRRPRGAHGL